MDTSKIFHTYRLNTDNDKITNATFNDFDLEFKFEGELIEYFLRQGSMSEYKHRLIVLNMLKTLDIDS